MIQKLLFPLLLILSIMTVSGQRLVGEFNDFFVGKKKQKHALVISDHNNDDLTFITQEADSINVFLLDKDYTIKNTSSSSFLGKPYINCLGYSTTDNSYEVFFSNKKHKKFGVIKYDLNTNVIHKEFLDFNIKKELFLDTFIYNNKLHLISFKRLSSTIYIYTFESSSKISKHTFDFKDVVFTNRNFIDMSVHTQLGPENGNFSAIRSDSPVTISITSKLVKIYPRNNILSFTFDADFKDTKICNINLETFEYSFKSIPKPLRSNTKIRNSNSFLLDTTLFQVASSSKKFAFTITNLSTSEVIKSILVDKEDTLHFKNSPIIQDKSFPFVKNNKIIRKLEKTSKFLRKISNARLGISAQKIDTVFTVNIGSVVDAYKGGYGGFSVNAAGTPGMIVGSTIGFSGYQTQNYRNYQYQKSTFINCLFNQEFNSTYGDIPKNSFDKMLEFEKNYKDLSAKNIFIYKGLHHFSFFDPKTISYKIYQFEK